MPSRTWQHCGHHEQLRHPRLEPARDLLRRQAGLVDGEWVKRGRKLCSRSAAGKRSANSVEGSHARSPW